MRLNSFVITTGELSNNPNKTVTVSSGTGKRLTIDTSGGTMDLANARVIVGDGSSTRTLTFVYTVTNDSHLPASSAGEPGNASLLEARIVKAIEGTSGSTLDVSTTSTISQESDGVDVLISPTTANTVTVTLAQGGTSADPSTFITVSNVGTGKRLTMTATNASNKSSLNGATMTVNDGNGNSRVIRFSSSFTNDLDIITLDGTPDDVENHFVRCINGTTGGSINVTATSITDDSMNAVIDIMHSSGGNVTVTLDQNSAMGNPADIISISDISGGSSTYAVADDFITGSVQSLPLSSPIVSKITLRQGRTNVEESLASYNVISEDISHYNGSVHVTGSLSANTNPNSTEAKSVSGDFLIISQGS